MLEIFIPYDNSNETFKVSPGWETYGDKNHVVIARKDFCVCLFRKTMWIYNNGDSSPKYPYIWQDGKIHCVKDISGLRISIVFETRN